MSASKRKIVPRQATTYEVLEQVGLIYGEPLWRRLRCFTVTSDRALRRKIKQLQEASKAVFVDSPPMRLRIVPPVDPLVRAGEMDDDTEGGA